MAEQIEFFRGNKALRGEPPILILAAVSEEKRIFGEHLIFTGLEKSPVLIRRHEFKPNHEEYWGFLRETCPLPEVFAAQRNCATDQFENAVFETDSQLHAKFFWNGFPFAFVPIERPEAIRIVRTWILLKGQTAEIAKTKTFQRGPIAEFISEASKNVSNFKIEVPILD